ncbi:uncharacterized protein LOC132611922 [Lycium barbarum]|uniref:uncharacterized protein LOC132611922 n=1 Tax=Lycium barbarum TaxID=112863 RepID=UPI00293E5D77|nr:uncharacterized protein LOC132611922 [Lycium barbarum]
MDFVSGLPRTKRNHDAIWVIVDRLTKSAHFLAIRVDYPLECLAELNVNEIVRLHGVPVSIIMRFGQKGKLSPRFIGPYEVLERVGRVASKLSLPHELDKIHNVFHVSMLRRYHSDPSHVLPVESIEVTPDLTYEEEPVQLLAHETKELGNKEIPLERVLWRNHSSKDATWEREEDMRIEYPHLFRD